MNSNNFLLGVISFLLLGTLYLTYKNSQEIQTLRQENADLYLKIDSMLQTCKEQPQQPVATEADSAPQSIGSVLIDYLKQLGDNDDSSASKTEKKKIVVQSKYRIEDRYVRYKIKEPEVKGNQAGEVVISILVNHSGEVSTAKVKSITGITNEEVIEACKKAALKTQFNIAPNYEFDKKQSGTITYTFSMQKV